MTKVAAAVVCRGPVDCDVIRPVPQTACVGYSVAGAGGPAPLCDPYGLDSLVSSLHGPGDALSQPLPPPAADRYQDDFSPPEYGDGFPADLTAGGMAYSPIRYGTARPLIR